MTVSETSGRRSRDWGPWYLHPVVPVLWTEAGGHVDLGACVTADEVLDWICHVAGKRWSTNLATQRAVVAGLVGALRDVLRPQILLCHTSQVDRSQVRALIERAREQFAGNVRDAP
jgi:hypothetical protein